MNIVWCIPENNDDFDHVQEEDKMRMKNENVHNDSFEY